MSDLATRIRDVNVLLIEDGNTEAIEEYFSTNYVVNFGGSAKKGHGAVRGFTKAIHDAFSELSVDVEVFVESDDRISWQRTIHGTQTGAFQGFPASGLEIVWRDMVVSDTKSGVIIREWVVTDLAEALLRSKKH
ncbi:MAG: ester cyclase [Woeseiaceae bacterium]